MPTYEYECKKCQHKFEVSQSMTAKPISECPKCHSSKVKRLIGSGAGIIFKGSGFYATDYRKDRSEKAVCPSAKENNPNCSACQYKDKKSS